MFKRESFNLPKALSNFLFNSFCALKILEVLYIVINTERKNTTKAPKDNCQFTKSKITTPTKTEKN